MKDIIIIGASGFGKQTANVVLSNGDNLLGFLDDDKSIKEFFGKPVLGAVSDFAKFKDAYFNVSIGNAKTRERIVNAMDRENVKWYTAIHKNACISEYDVTIGEGCVILAGAIVDAGVKIGRHTLLNCNSVVAHDGNIGNFVHISVGTNVAGTVHIDDRTWVGVGASVSNNINICSDCMIGAGTVVVKDITEPGTYVGVPAKRR